MDPAGPISTDQVLDALERVTISSALRRSPQLIAFLSYVVREELAGLLRKPLYFQAVWPAGKHVQYGNLD